MSPVTLAELDPKSRALALQQIGEASGTTATVEKKTFTTLGDPASMTDDQLADIVIEGVKKIRGCLPYIIAMKARFDVGGRDRTNRLKTPIKGCYSWKEFCKTRLDRTPQTIGEALAPEPSPESSANSVACTCPDCGQSLPSRNQLRKHGQSNHHIPSTGIADFLRRSNGDKSILTAAETQWISKENRCPTGKRGFDYPDDIWQLMRAEGTIEATDFVAYIGKCGQCGRSHRDKDQSGYKEGDVPTRHQTWYRPDGLNQQTAFVEPSVPTIEFETLSYKSPFEIELTPKNIKDTRCLSMAKERLIFAWGKVELLVDAANHPDWAEEQSEIVEALGVYRQAFQEFAKFAAQTIDFIEKNIAARNGGAA